MNKEEIIRMARDAGGHEKHLVMYMDFDDIERFAALVAEREREECAKVCEAMIYGRSLLGDCAREECADAIRARSTS